MTTTVNFGVIKNNKDLQLRLPPRLLLVSFDQLPRRRSAPPLTPVYENSPLLMTKLLLLLPVKVLLTTTSTASTSTSTI